MEEVSRFVLRLVKFGHELCYGDSYCLAKNNMPCYNAITGKVFALNCGNVMSYLLQGKRQEVIRLRLQTKYDAFTVCRGGSAADRLCFDGDGI